MKGRFYRLTRSLHLYLGLFISPFVLVFSVSVFFFVHSWTPKLAPDTARTRVVSSLNLLTDLPKLSGRPFVDALKPILESNETDDPRNHRDWALTYLWAYSMDAVVAGLIFMVLSSVFMWLQLPQKRWTGAIVLGLGCLSCGLFCLGLRWLF